MSIREHTAGAVPGHRPGGPGPGLLHDPLRVLVVLGVAVSTVLHGQMAILGVHGAVWSLVMVGMAVMCLSCVAPLLRPGRSIAARHPAMTMTMGMALAMALGHVLMLPLITGGNGGAHAHHTGGSGRTTLAADPSSGHGTMLLVIAVELVVAATATTWARRHRIGR
ncbi:hypothetical protein [Kocuria rosea]|uniref:DUF5134 domain-containing protein n=1 Tax=Kocuria rosea TaxID=1275 RepID=A0A4R5Y3E7_KOCRO|nr:hypothetical protein [Kocuria rosea]TDL38136.1 hypothetical protein E2R59_17010 [Kocuria rosea]